MRYNINLAVLLVVLFTGCSKTHKQSQVYGGCIQNLAIDNPYYSNLSPEDSVFAMSLITKSWPLYAGFRLLSVSHHSSYDNNLITTVATMQQYVNGLPVFTTFVSLSFLGDSLQSVNGKWVSTTPDNIRSLSLDTLKSIFFEQIAKESAFIQREATEYRCLTATFGYYDLNSGTGNDTANIVKAWKLYPAEKMVPVAYINDNGTLILFDSGVRY